jgi:Mrp family chromosome partitioning ATPase
VAANLATAIALEESSTALVVDCNRQKMSGQQTFSWPDVQETPVGLAAYIRSEKVSTEDIIRPTGIPRLRRIAMGDSRGISGECFSTVRMRGLIQELSNRYTDRYIILDAPSPVATGDVGVLAEFCDWVILVVPYGGGTSQQINEAAAIVGPNRVLGCVFNHCPRWPAAPV